MRGRESGTRGDRLLLPDEVVKMSDMQGADGAARPSPEGRLAGEYRQIVSAFNGIVRLHVASLSKILDIIGSSNSIAGLFDTGGFSGAVDELPDVGRATKGTPNLPKSNVMDLIGDARKLSEAAVEGKLTIGSGNQ